jgi:RNA-directed DNA polymerase
LKFPVISTTVADDARARGVRPCHSSGEVSEQARAIGRGTDGAKGRGQGECGPANHVPGTEPGKRVTSAGTHTTSSKAKEEGTVHSLFHHVSVDLLRLAFFELKRNAAPGVDGLTWQDYEADLEFRLVDLHARVQRGAYRALPSRRRYIPKPDGRQRPLAVAALEDKIVQRAVAAVLNAIYEEDFLGFSYGFRPKRGQHDALGAGSRPKR